MPVRIQRYIAILSVVLLIIKLWAWSLTHSVAILTDALESTVNVITGFFGLYSVILAAKPRDTNHPFGHGKVEFISAGIEGSLIILSGFFIIYEAIHQLLHSAMPQQLNVGIWLTLGSGAVNFAFGRYAVSEGKKYRSATIESAGRHLLTDAYSTIAIVLGLGLLLLTKWAWLDSAVALCFSLVIIINGYKVLRRSLAGIMDEADETLIRSVIQVMEKHRKPQWIDLHNMRVIQYGDVVHMDAHMTMPWYYRVADAEKEIHEVEDIIRANFGSKVEVFIHTDACMPYSCKLCALDNCPVRQEAFKELLTWNIDNAWADAKHGKGGEATGS